MINWDYSLENEWEMTLINEAWLRIYGIDLNKNEINIDMFIDYTNILANDSLDNPKTMFGYIMALKNYKNEYFKINKELHYFFIKEKNKILNYENKLKGNDANIDENYHQAEAIFDNLMMGVQ